jgi:hypothetical protein
MPHHASGPLTACTAAESEASGNRSEGIGTGSYALQHQYSTSGTVAVLVLSLAAESAPTQPGRPGSST